MIAITGGLAKSDIFVQTVADVCGLPVVRAENDHSVLLGSAMLGAAAHHKEGRPKSLLEIANSMGQRGVRFDPVEERGDFHARKYRVFRAMQEDQIKYREIMKS